MSGSVGQMLDPSTHDVGLAIAEAAIDAFLYPSAAAKFDQDQIHKLP